MCARRGPKTKFKARAITQRDRENLGRLLQNFGPDVTTSRRVQDEFRRFLLINSLSVAEGIGLFISQQAVNGVSPSTLQTYLGYLAPVFASQAQAAF